MRFRSLLPKLFVLTCLLVPSVPDSAFALQSDAVKNAKLPNGNWVWKAADPDEPDAKTMYVKKTGEAVSIRLNSYDVPISAQRFLESVREKIMAKPDYAGAQVDLVNTKDVNGKAWSVFAIKRKDEINQEIWGRKMVGEAVFMVIFTGAGSYYTDYHGDMMEFIQGNSK